MGSLLVSVNQHFPGTASAAPHKAQMMGCCPPMDTQTKTQRTRARERVGVHVCDLMTSSINHAIHANGVLRCQEFRSETFFSPTPPQLRDTRSGKAGPVSGGRGLKFEDFVQNKSQHFLCTAACSRRGRLSPGF